MALETTTLASFAGQVILTEGMATGDGQTIYGIFANEEDARSDNPDALALGTVGADQLTEEQRAMAARNSERLAADYQR